MTNLEIVHAVYRSVSESDFDTFRGLCAPDVEWRQNVGFPNGGRRLGADAVVKEVFNRFAAEWSEWRYETDEILEVGSTLVVLGAYEGTYAKTRKHMRAEAAHVFWLKDGRIIRFRQFADTKIVHDAMH
ncbi:MAG TPA: nuclear transport factor 2 family protein [Lacunisphaera sp.]|jgi:hypothetical protein